jgi:hypothetical protein
MRLWESMQNMLLLTSAFASEVKTFQCDVSQLRRTIDAKRKARDLTAEGKQVVLDFESFSRFQACPPADVRAGN